MMAEEKKQAEEQTEATEDQKEKGAPLWMMTIVVLVSVAGIFGAMYFFLDHIRGTYVTPYYRMLHTLEQRDDSLRVTAVAEVSPEEQDSILEYQARSDSLSSLAAKQYQQIGKLEKKMENYEQERLQLSSKDVKKLAGIIGSMKAPRAASIMVKLDQESIIQVLMSINQRNAAKIMAAMPTDKAASIARQIQRQAEQAASSGNGQ